MSHDIAEETLKTHPVAAIFPLLDGDELQQLADDIRAHGLLEPIITHEGKILDGRNRQRACELAGIEPGYEEWVSNGRTPLEFAIAKNLHRRHLTSAQKAVLALDLLPQLEQEAKERQRLSKGRGKKVPRTQETFSDTGTATAKAAELVGISHSSVEKAKSIQRQDANVIDLMRAGKIPTVAAAARAANQRVPEIVFGKEDHFNQATAPLVRYLKVWATRDSTSRHVYPEEAQRRLTKLQALVTGIELLNADLEAIKAKGIGAADKTETDGT
jgi:ParB-like chromosome segregation protein Spo0J